jgi:3,4-dihydroxy 2-butanone 4-phosphate synthase/GTP cyclohydrolase II
MSEAKRPAGLATTDELLAEVRAGRMVVLVDDEQRENEGDLILPAATVTSEMVAFTIRYTGGVICLAMPNELANHLELPPMVEHNSAPRRTAYTVSIEAREGVTTGISAQDRATTIRTTVKPGVTANDLVRPGHVFPLRARDGGVLRRAGHTEAAIDVCRLAGLAPVGAISELMHDDGTMMRLPAILEFAREHGLCVGTIEDLVRHRIDHEPYVQHVARAALPVGHAHFDIHGYRDQVHHGEHVALALGDVGDGDPVLVRVHLECLAGDLLGSLHCGCGPRRTAALDRITHEGRGVLVYLRGIGLRPETIASACDTQVALEPSIREATIAGQILRSLGVRSARLLASDPVSTEVCAGLGVPVVEQVVLGRGH